MLDHSQVMWPCHIRVCNFDICVLPHNCMKLWACLTRVLCHIFAIEKNTHINCMKLLSVGF